MFLFDRIEPCESVSTYISFNHVFKGITITTTPAITTTTGATATTGTLNQLNLTQLSPDQKVRSFPHNGIFLRGAPTPYEDRL